MIYVTGDIHGDTDRLLNISAMKSGGPGKGDILIVCGDFGFVWYGDGRDEEKLNRLSELEFTILFADGNHENFSALERLPRENRYGAMVGVVTPKIVHLERGEVYCVEGKSIFVMGGGASTDLMLRKSGIDWWEMELPSAAEYSRAKENLDRMNGRVDIIISHTAPLETAALLAPANPNELKLRAFLSEIAEGVEFDNWFFGHFHTDMSISGGFRCLYRDVVCISNI